jgi:2-polyprenyl-3-methyl-5-hydroxy-6-metoxy-1,4-benzoquinol methylase
MCLLCSGESRDYLDYCLLDKGDYKLKKCRNCGLVFTDPLPDESFLNQFYQDYDNIGEQDLYYYNLVDYRNTLAGRDLESNFVKLDRKYSFNHEFPVLDLGSGGGAFLDILKRHDFNAWGVEVSQRAVDFASSKFEVSSEVGSVLDYETEQASIGTIFMWDLLEHLSDQRKIISKINGWLVSGGHLVIETPNSNSLISEFIILLTRLRILWPAKWFFGFHHLFWHSFRSITKLLLDNGFEILEIKKKNTPAQRIFPNNFKYIVAKILLMKINITATISGKQNKMIIIARKVK